MYLTTPEDFKRAEAMRTHGNYDGFVYAVEFGEYVKIGSSKNIKDRIKSLRSMCTKYCGKTLGRAYISEPHINYIENERLLHEVFSGVCVRGSELFDISIEDVVKQIDSMDLVNSESDYEKFGKQDVESSEHLETWYMATFGVNHQKQIAEAISEIINCDMFKDELKKQMMPIIQEFDTHISNIENIMDNYRCKIRTQQESINRIMANLIIDSFSTDELSTLFYCTEDEMCTILSDIGVQYFDNGAWYINMQFPKIDMYALYLRDECDVPIPHRWYPSCVRLIFDYMNSNDFFKGHHK